MKIAFLSSADPTDLHSWSGTLFHLYHTLAAWHEVVWRGPEALAEAARLHRAFKGKMEPFAPCLYTEKIGEVLAYGLEKERFDLVFAHDDFLIARLETDTPVVYLTDATYHLTHGDTLPDRLAEAEEQAEREAIRRADLILYSSEWARCDAMLHYGARPERVHVASFGANLPAAATAEGTAHEARGECRLLFVGSPWANKGGPTAYAAYRALRHKGFPCSLTIVGSVPPSGEVNEADKHLHIFPRLDKSRSDELERLCRLYREAHFLILPTRFDCFGIVFAEASAFGVPSIAPDVGGVGAAVRSGENGILLPRTATPDDYAETIRRTFEDKAAYARLCDGARREFGERLNWNAWARQALPLIDTLKKQPQMTTDIKPISTYIVNLRSRPDRREHILKEFAGRPEFQPTFVDAMEHTVGAVGLWQSLCRVVRTARERGETAFLFCEDDHQFTPHYAAESWRDNVRDALRSGADLVSGGVGGFGAAVPVARGRFWVDWFWCTQFVVVTERLYDAILGYDFAPDDTTDGVLSRLARQKQVVYPFVSVQKPFGYSDVAARNAAGPDDVTRFFAEASRRLELMHRISIYYNYPWAR